MSSPFHKVEVVVSVGAGILLTPVLLVVLPPVIAGDVIVHKIAKGKRKKQVLHWKEVERRAIEAGNTLQAHYAAVCEKSENFGTIFVCSCNRQYEWILE